MSKWPCHEQVLLQCTSICYDLILLVLRQTGIRVEGFETPNRAQPCHKFLIQKIYEVIQDHGPIKGYPRFSVFACGDKYSRGIIEVLAVNLEIDKALEEKIREAVKPFCCFVYENKKGLVCLHRSSVRETVRRLAIDSELFPASPSLPAKTEVDLFYPLLVDVLRCNAQDRVSLNHLVYNLNAQDHFQGVSFGHVHMFD